MWFTQAYMTDCITLMLCLAPIYTALLRLIPAKLVVVYALLSTSLAPALVPVAGLRQPPVKHPYSHNFVS